MTYARWRWLERAHPGDVSRERLADRAHPSNARAKTVPRSDPAPAVDARRRPNGVPHTTDDPAGQHRHVTPAM